MSLEKMADIVDQARESQYLLREAEEAAWIAEHRAKAHVILALLRQHLPVQILLQVEGYLSTSYGSKCVCDLLESEPQRRKLLAERPDATDEEIDKLLGIGQGDLPF
jgi:hypothetical protein